MVEVQGDKARVVENEVREGKGKEREGGNLEVVVDIELIRLDGLDLRTEREKSRVMARFFNLNS